MNKEKQNFEKKFFECETAKLIPYQFNNKKHPKDQIDMVVNSIGECGFLNPILIDENFVILAGHGRLEASKIMNLESLPVIQYFGLTDIQKKKFRILDNRLADFGEYDISNLELELKEIGDEKMYDMFSDLDLKFDGYEELEYDETKDDVIPEIEEEIFVQKGDLFQLGQHRLLCGDVTDLGDISMLMGELKADMIFTDPPYNVNYKGMGKNTSNGIKNDNMSEDDFSTFLDKTFQAYKSIVKPNAGIYIFHSTSTQAQFESYIKKNGFEIKNQLIRNKPMASLGWGDYRRKHEPFFYCTTKGQSASFYGDRTHGTVIDFFDKKTDTQILNMIKKAREYEKQGKTTIRSMKRENVNEYVHPTQKPVELITYAINNSSKKNEIVVDFFGGSGSTMIACEKTSRVCFSLELDPKYVQTIIRRYQEYTNGKREVKCLNRDLVIPM